MKESHLKKTIPTLISKIEKAISQCLEIIELKIAEDLSDDKLHNVLKAKRMASEDIEFYCNKIDSLQKILDGTNEEEEEVKNALNPAKKYARNTSK